MLRILILSLVIASLAAPPTEKTEPRRVFTPEDACSRSGGICVHHSVCSTPAQNPDGCTLQKSDGAVCCQTLPDDETACGKLGGICRETSSCRRGILTRALDCPASDAMKLNDVHQYEKAVWDKMTNKRAHFEKANRNFFKSFGIFSLFRFATNADVTLIAVGSILAIAHGASGPILALVFGEMTNSVLKTEERWNASFGNESLWEDVSPGVLQAQHLPTFALYYCYVAIVVMFSSFAQSFCWELSCERQSYRFREKFFSQILRQDIAWFESQTDLTTQLSNDLERVRDGTGHKMSMIVQYFSGFLTGISVGLYANVKLTLAVLTISPILVICAALLARNAASSAAREQLKYAKAGKIAEEVLTSVRTVMAFGGQDKEVDRYGKSLDEGYKETMSAYYFMAVGVSAYYFVVYSSYGGAFWLGSWLIVRDEATPGAVFTVLLSAMGGALLLGGALPFMSTVSTAVGSASNLFAVIDRTPDIDPYSTKGQALTATKGAIKFENVFFRYPSRPSVPILSGLNLDIKPGTTVAFVGSSGAGKSTLASLLLRFYDPDKGKIYLEGIDLKELSVKWLRAQIGLVSQEPVLFALTISENIRYGREDVTNEEVITAAKLANAHQFINRLPLKYETQVGERGTQLSGGQKQKIAIARALVRNPQILLLDEATSALDAESEAEVQSALDEAMSGRTTIIIAHRLSTIRKAQIIYAMKNGVIDEYGSHDELMQKKGLYYNLVNAPHAKNSSAKVSTLSPESLLLVEPKQEADAVSTEVLNLEQNPEPSSDVSFYRIFKANFPEWPWLILSAVACVITGLIVPAFAFLYGESFQAFQLEDRELLAYAMFLAFLFIGLAVVAAGSQSLLVVAMTNASERLLLRIRLEAFRNILRQAAGWFDLDEHASGKLTTRLAREAPMIKMAGGLRAGQIISAIATLTAAITLALIQGWQLACLLLLAGPIVASATYNEMRLLRKNLKRDAELMADAGRIATEAIQNIKTVQGLGQEGKFLETYLNLLEEPFIEAKSQALNHSLVFAFSQSVVSLLHAATFGFGGYLLQNGYMTPSQLYKTFFVISLSSASIGRMAAYFQDLAKAKLSAGLIFQLIDTKTDIDASTSTGEKPEIIGKITFRKISFRYPSRPDTIVLHGANLEINAGETVAIVGASGSGKSTFVSLLLRFYEPHRGSVLVDGQDIRDLNLPHLRRHIGLVTQEPTLFACSLAENIAYGESRLEMGKIIQAAKAANIHHFIASLPHGYDTTVGDRGMLLSGGQKQRIAIARALLRNPKILVLDEATSALDTESERTVQEALEKARVGRTCIIIAHRLSTVKNSDRIAVLKEGVIAEIGTHRELMAKNGLYSDLVLKQQ